MEDGDLRARDHAASRARHVLRVRPVDAVRPGGAAGNRGVRHRPARRDRSTSRCAPHRRPRAADVVAVEELEATAGARMIGPRAKNASSWRAPSPLPAARGVARSFVVFLVKAKPAARIRGARASRLDLPSRGASAGAACVPFPGTMNPRPLVVRAAGSSFWQTTTGHLDEIQPKTHLVRHNERRGRSRFGTRNGARALERSSTGPPDQVVDVRWSPDTRLLLLAYGGIGTMMFDARSGERLALFPGSVGLTTAVRRTSGRWWSRAAPTGIFDPCPSQSAAHRRRALATTLRQTGLVLRKSGDRRSALSSSQRAAVPTRLLPRADFCKSEGRTHLQREGRHLSRRRTAEASAHALRLTTSVRSRSEVGQRH